MLLQRVITAVSLLVLMIAILLLTDNQGWTVFCSVLAICGLYEYARIMKMALPLTLAYCLLTLILFGAICYYQPLELMAQNNNLSFCFALLLGLFWFVAVPVILIKKIKINNKIIAVLIGWILFIPLWMYLSELFSSKTETGVMSLFTVNLIILYLVLLVWVADIAAYFAGKAFGKHKLAPQISPGKSVEGALGAIVAVVIFSVAYYFVFFFNPATFNWKLLLIWSLFSIPLCWVSILGDLFESWLKRVANVKDSGRLLPGHGGVFDRVDSLIAVLAMYPIFRYLLTITAW